MLKSLIILGLTCTLISCNKVQEGEGFIPVVGLDSKGKSDLKLVPAAVFHQQMSPLIGELSDEVSNTLELENSLEQTPWTLSRVTVGLALEAEFDLLGAIEAEGHGDIELRFQKTN